MRRIVLPLTLMVLAGNAAAETYTTASPDGQVVVTLDKSGADLPTWRVTYKGEPLIAPSATGLRTDMAGFGLKGFKAPVITQRTVNEIYNIVLGKAKSAPDHFNETTLTFEEVAGEAGVGRKMAIVVRAYDNGAAVRYVLPNQPGFESFGILGEKTEFAFPKDYDCWGLTSVNSTTPTKVSLMRSRRP